MLRIRPISLIVCLFIFLAATYSFGIEAPKPAPNEIEKSEICMVANRVPGEPTIAVPIEGKTYYVCCENCEARIKANPSIRYSIDPLTGRKINKADSFIKVNKDGSVTYFESAENARKFYSSAKKRKL
ncbi:MAG: TRASH domain-containing protein [Deltaproteobacteria bacterium]|nr:TRASH domain-containing protein [Deltaproteobacteria bacterium]